MGKVTSKVTPSRPARPPSSPPPAKPPSRPPSSSGVTPAAGTSQEMQAKLQSLQSEFGSLQSSLLLTDVQNDLGSVETTLSLLPAEIEQLRTRGHVFRSFLENKINVLKQQWATTRGRVNSEITRRVQELEQEANVTGNALRMASSGQASQVARAESAINMLQSKVTAAQSATRALYETLKQNVDQTKQQVEQIRWLLDQTDEASFQLHPAEDAVAACRAQYLEQGQKDGGAGRTD
jgi:chromosome segregation ATPase